MLHLTSRHDECDVEVAESKTLYDDIQLRPTIRLGNPISYHCGFCVDQVRLKALCSYRGHVSWHGPGTDNRSERLLYRGSAQFSNPTMAMHQDKQHKGEMMPLKEAPWWTDIMIDDYRWT